MSRNGFCFLVDRLPKHLKINGHTLTLDTRTSTALSVILFLQEPHSNLEKAQYTATRLLPDFLNHPISEVMTYLGVSEEKLAEVLFKFLHGYPEVKSWKQLHAEGEKTPVDAPDKTTNKLPSFDFVQDSDAIISAMRQVYGLNLDEVRSLHWWEFLALFNNLPEGTMFSSIRKIRTMKINPKDSAERKQEIKQAQKSVALVDTRSPEQKRADLQAQMNDLEL